MADATAGQLPQLPDSPDALADASWDDIAPWYRSLAAAELDTVGAENWLRCWSDLEALVSEAASRAMMAYTGDTTNSDYQEAHIRFSSRILPLVDEQSVALARKLVAHGYRRPDLEQVLARFQRRIDLFSEDNVAILAQLEEMATNYQDTTGGLTVTWDGTEMPLPRLQPFLKDRDRATRERAFRSTCEAYLRVRPTLSRLFDRMFEARGRVAGNAGSSNYQDYAFAAKCRFDYGPEECSRFHDGVAATVVPALARRREARRKRLGLDRLRPWDLAVDPNQRPAIRPFETDEEFRAKARRLFQRVDAELGAQFGVMDDEGYLDLESRTGKAPGGYCDTLHVSGRPFIFMNAVGLMGDVRTLLHESGHAFHAFASHELPLVWQRYPGAEIAELASMSMELLAAPYLSMPQGFLTKEQASVAWVEQLDDILETLAHVAAVDAFQSWIYTSGKGHDAGARDEAWLSIRDRFDPVVDWTDLADHRVSRWYRQLHIFLYPFYYIEYGIAQLGALQVWRNAQNDWAGALDSYRKALALGATTSLPEMYHTAGAEVLFDSQGMGPLITMVEQAIERAEEQAIAS